MTRKTPKSLLSEQAMTVIKTTLIKASWPKSLNFGIHKSSSDMRHPVMCTHFMNIE